MMKLDEWIGLGAFVVFLLVVVGLFVIDFARQRRWWPLR